VEGGDSSGISGTGETQQGAQRAMRLTARPVERVRLERKTTVCISEAIFNGFFQWSRLERPFTTLHIKEKPHTVGEVGLLVSAW